MSEGRSRGKERKRLAGSSPPAGWHDTRARAKKSADVADEETIPSNAVKTDHEILSIAMRDIGMINKALKTKAPITKLKSSSNVVSAYKEFMRKGREERKIHRPWEDDPNDKLFDRGIHNFSRVVQEYSSWSKRNRALAKDYRLSQFIDVNPKRFGAMPCTEEARRRYPSKP